MPFVGELLREEREDQGRTLKEVSASINVGENYLAALEKGEYEAIPGETFIKGFIRNYAIFLGLDGSAMVEEYKKDRAAFTEPAAEREPVKKSQPKARRPAARAKKKQGNLPRVTIIIGGILFLLLCLWLFI